MADSVRKLRLLTMFDQKVDALRGKYNREMAGVVPEELLRLDIEADTELKWLREQLFVEDIITALERNEVTVTTT